MKRLACLIILAESFISSAQSFPVKNVNDDYVVTTLKGSEKFKNNIQEVLLDKKGIYWFQSPMEVSSFDGVNWKSYGIKTSSGREIPLRINEIEFTDDGITWLGTSDGFFMLDPVTAQFIPLKQKYPQLNGLPLSINCLYKAKDNFLFVSLLENGFNLFNWQKIKLAHVDIDTTNKTTVLRNDIETGVTYDMQNNFWGLTNEQKGIWCYNSNTGKMLRSWKGELAFFPAEKYLNKNLTGITYSEKNNAIWLSYGPAGKLEKINLTTGKRDFYAFSGNLQVKADTTLKNRYALLTVKIDRNKDEWVVADRKYLVKLNDDISRVEYLINDPEMLPMPRLNWLVTETIQGKNTEQNSNVGWIAGNTGLSVIRRRNKNIRQLPFEIVSTAAINASDFENVSNRKNVFFSKRNSSYYIFQQDAGRPKIISLDNSLHITNALFNDQWKDYPAYFNTDISSDTFYIAILKPGVASIDFRTTVVKDFKVNLKTLQAEEIKADFANRIMNYGIPDAENCYWLFSNGYLYSYNPGTHLLDSIYIRKSTTEKDFYTLELVKGSDYPTVLHKKSSTFWIEFIPGRELYKVNLRTRKIEKVFKSCFDGKDCKIPGGIFDMYPFDSARIYLQQSFSALLINVFTDSITYYDDLFSSRLAVDSQMGSGVHKNWFYNITPEEINLANNQTGSQKKLLLGSDFKWRISQLNCPPLVNEKNEMILICSGQKGFLVLNLDSISNPPKPGNIYFSFIKIDDRFLSTDSLLNSGKLILKYNRYNSLHFGFSDLSALNQDMINYEYTLFNGGDTIWNQIQGKPELTFSRISPGNYRLLIRANNGFGDYSPAISVFNLLVKPPFTQTGWFLILLMLIGAAILYASYRYRMQQVYKLQDVRNNIASDLHDDIGSTLNSISIYSEVAKQQAGKEIPALDLIGSNSRQIIESMSDIVWTINPQNDSFEKIITRMRSFAYQLLKAKKIEFTFEADEKLNSISLPMQVRKNFYLVFKEAITNLVKYSGATRVSIVLHEKNKTILLQIRDNGSGIKISPETQGNGLLNMKRRAEEINAAINIESATGIGTGIEMELKI